MSAYIPGYTDDAGVTNRANSALLRIEHIMDQRHVPSAVRLVWIAQVMKDEPILTDGSSSAFRARRDAKSRKGPYA